MNMYFDFDICDKAVKFKIEEKKNSWSKEEYCALTILTEKEEIVIYLTPDQAVDLLDTIYQKAGGSVESF